MSGVCRELFTAGRTTTSFIPTHGEEVLGAIPPLRTPLAALALYAAPALGLGHNPKNVALALPWAVPLRFTLDGDPRQAALLSLGGGACLKVHPCWCWRR